MDAKSPLNEKTAAIPDQYGTLAGEVIHGACGDPLPSKTEDVTSPTKKSCLNWPAIVGLVVVLMLLLGLTAVMITWVVLGNISTSDVSGNFYGAMRAAGGRNNPVSTQQDGADRIDCYAESAYGVDVMTQQNCEARGCVYAPHETYRVPWCHVPQTLDYGFRVTAGPIQTQYGETWQLRRKNTLGVYDDNFDNVTFEIEMRDDNILHFKFETPEDPDRYEIPWQPDLPDQPASNPAYQVYVYNHDPFSFRVIRISSGTVIWDTGVGGLVFADKFLQIATRLPTSNIYGFGENMHKQFRHNMGYQQWPIFARDQAPDSNTGPSGTTDSLNLNTYSSYPFYECTEADGQAHGVLLWNNNAMDYTLTPEPMLVYKLTGGIMDFYIFMGPTPENVIQEYTGAVGRPMIPPYWSLGFQLSRYGYKNTSDMRAALDRTQAHGIPLDLQYADIDYMDRQRSFTLDHENFTDLPEYMDELRAQGMRSVLIVNPFVEIAEDYETYTRGRALNVFTEFPSIEDMPPGDYELYNRTDVMGTVWPEWIVAFVDFFKSSTEDFWTTEIGNLNELIKFDGIWLDMNEPANFDTNGDRAWNWPVDRLPYYTLKCPSSEWDDPPYRSKAAFMFDDAETFTMERLSFKTICMTSVHGDSQEFKHYDVHNLYGHMMLQTTWNALMEVHGADQRPMIISRSMTTGDARYGGRWLGDNTATWLDLKLSIIGMLESNLFGIPYIGADICGFFNDCPAELCKRWHQLGAFYPYARNHNHEATEHQDPGFYGDDVAVAAREILLERYRLLPYLYTLFYRANVDGNTVIRPLFHEFGYDEATLTIESQFLWGAALLLSPILEENASVLSLYLPPARWYDYWTGSLESDTGGMTVNKTVDSESPPAIHIRGGYILPTQQPDITTTASRLNPFGLKVALDQLDGAASGELFWDDGNTLDTVAKGSYNLASFTSSQNSLDMTAVYSNTSVVAGLAMDTVDIYGVSAAVSVTVNGQPITSFSFDDTLQILRLTALGLPMESDFVISWSGTQTHKTKKAFA